MEKRHIFSFGLYLTVNPSTDCGGSSTLETGIRWKKKRKTGQQDLNWRSLTFFFRKKLSLDSRKQSHHRVHLVAVLELLIISHLLQQLERAQLSCSKFHFSEHFKEDHVIRSKAPEQLLNGLFLIWRFKTFLGHGTNFNNAKMTKNKNKKTLRFHRLFISLTMWWRKHKIQVKISLNLTASIPFI